MLNKFYILAIGFFIGFSAVADTIPTGFSRPMTWRVGAEISPAIVPGTNMFLKGDNLEDKRIGSALSGDIRADFSFNRSTREGMLYRGVYQGMGLGVKSFFAGKLLGTPVSAYVYQGAPLYYFSSRVWLGYEWQFGAAFGWKHYEKYVEEYNTAIGGSVTAHMGLDFKLHYAVSDRWVMSIGVGANHYSNGNTSWPNGGVNSIGASVGLAYVINSHTDNGQVDRALETVADSHRWFYDIMAYGAWRKRIVIVGDPGEPQLCPGRFGVVGLQFAPLYRLNRWVGIGPALDMQWDESAGLEPYWVIGSSDDNIMFERPPFGKQMSLGVSAHAELTMPIFALNAGIGYDMLCPQGDNRFYQSLTLKTFLTKKLYLNTGYRLGNFKDPQNLMLGVGVRL